MAGKKKSQKAKGGPDPKWVIDTHGLKAALETSSNSVRTKIITSIESGEMLIMRYVSDELKAMYPERYADLQSFSHKKYLAIGVADQALAGVLIDSFGSSIGGIPGPEMFETLAAAHLSGLTLVTYGKAFKQSKNIAAKCSCLPPVRIDHFE